ncbi:hypothetical protein HDV57DRAFT_299136 [Trichoderma longibrachiatum]
MSPWPDCFPSAALLAAAACRRNAAGMMWRTPRAPQDFRSLGLDQMVSQPPRRSWLLLSPRGSPRGSSIESVSNRPFFGAKAPVQGQQRAGATGGHIAISTRRSARQISISLAVTRTSDYQMARMFVKDELRPSCSQCRALPKYSYWTSGSTRSTYYTVEGKALAPWPLNW